MFKIRQEQMTAFQGDALRVFEERMVAHVGRCLPECMADLGEGRVREVIRLGIERAAVFDIVAERDVCKFIDLMLVFGTDFDVARAWAREILDDESESPRGKLQRLYEQASREP